MLDHWNVHGEFKHLLYIPCVNIVISGWWMSEGSVQKDGNGFTVLKMSPP